MLCKWNLGPIIKTDSLKDGKNPILTLKSLGKSIKVGKTTQNLYWYLDRTALTIILNSSKISGHMQSKPPEPK